MSRYSHLVARAQQRVDRREITRRALIDAAIKRFSESGVAGTSVADITGDAGVTERTFYRYFASKEEVLFAEYEDRIDWFRRALEVRPHHEPITTSVLYAVDAFPDDPRLVTEAAKLRTQLSDEHIAEHMQRVQGLLGQEIERHILTRGCDELPATVISSMIAAAVFSAMTLWTRQDGTDLARLHAMTEEALAIADSGVEATLNR
jgi:AcrR family transcriptional regulator